MFASDLETHSSRDINMKENKSTVGLNLNETVDQKCFFTVFLCWLTFHPTFTGSLHYVTAAAQPMSCAATDISWTWCIFDGAWNTEQGHIRTINNMRLCCDDRRPDRVNIVPEECKRTQTDTSLICLATVVLSSLQSYDFLCFICFICPYIGLN